MGNPRQGGRSQVEGLASCPCFMLTGKLLLLCFHVRDESAAGLSRGADSQRSRALLGLSGTRFLPPLFCILCGIPMFSPGKAAGICGEQRGAGVPGQSSARRSPYPEEFVRRGRGGRNPIPPFPRLGSQRASLPVAPASSRAPCVGPGLLLRPGSAGEGDHATDPATPPRLLTSPLCLRRGKVSPA